MPGLTFGFWRRASKPAGDAAPIVAKAPVAEPPRVDFDRILAGIRTAPQLEMIEWAGDAETPPAASEVLEPPADDTFDASTLEGRRRKIRDRYIAARFPGIARSGVELVNEEQVIRAARLLFEDERTNDALELLELAVEECPANQDAWLARLEILYLARDGAEFTEAARAFRIRHGSQGEAWAEVCRLGRALAPREALFEGRVVTRDHEHYGPWPHTPNWIRAPWDLTAEVAAADFHNAMKRERGAEAPSRA